MNPRKALLFVCMHNACRSQIAEAIAKELAPASWFIDSVGPRPADKVDPKAVELLRRKGLRLPESKRPKCHFDAPSHGLDCLVHFDDPAAGSHIAAKRLLRWDLPDPFGGPMERYEALFSDLEALITRLVEEMA